MESPLIMPSDKNRTLTVDRQVSKLVTMARQPNSSSGGSASISASTAPARPDITVSRADQNNPVIFNPKAAAPNYVGATEPLPTGKAK
jgi:hypothetical protein